jgi:16S rRNA C967 or C1407 C5-methylase (RsmB/RsmF family)
VLDPPAEFPVPADARGIFRLFPHRHGTDAFTAVRLRRRSRA